MGTNPNQSLQPTANPLRGLSVADLGRYDESVIGEEQWEIH